MTSQSSGKLSGCKKYRLRGWYGDYLVVVRWVNGGEFSARIDVTVVPVKAEPKLSHMVGYASRALFLLMLELEKEADKNELECVRQRTS